MPGWPSAVILRARERLAELEQSAQRHAEQQQSQLPLFGQAPLPPAESEVEHKLAQTDPDELTPKAALELVYQLKKML